MDSRVEAHANLRYNCVEIRLFYGAVLYKITAVIWLKWYPDMQIPTEIQTQIPTCSCHKSGQNPAITLRESYIYF